MTNYYNTFPSILMFGATLFLLLSAILAIFIPFWVWRIRNEVININGTLEKLLAFKEQQASSKTVSGSFPHEPAAKICMKCGRRNLPETTVCTDCNTDLI